MREREKIRAVNIRSIQKPTLKKKKEKNRNKRIIMNGAGGVSITLIASIDVWTIVALLFGKWGKTRKQL